MTYSNMLFAVIFVGELILFYYFYAHMSGVRAIYFTWFAWVIDCLGIMSGLIIMSLSIFAKNNPAQFNFGIPFEFVLLIFILGSWQTSIHAVKLFLRTFRNAHIKKTAR